MAKKLKNETGLLKEALRIVIDDAVKRGIVEFELDGQPYELTPVGEQEGELFIVFGDATNGRRLPTGMNNVRIGYRVGSGLRGNLPAGRLENAVRPTAANRPRSPARWQECAHHITAPSRPAATTRLPHSL